MSTFSQSQGDLVTPFAVVTDPAEEVAIRLTNRMRLFKGEWLLDQRVGVPWYQSILGQKSPQIPKIRLLLTSIVEKCPGVAEVLNSEFTFSEEARELTAFFRIRTQSGAILAGQLGGDFVVE